MKYALAENNQRIEALPKGRAVCPLCRTVVIARCGNHRFHHWAHEGLKNCDSWKEHETQWHLDWKNKFPVEWQEYPQHDEFGEKHIADVRTGQGLVIEFQHSPIDPREREARERFHKTIVWVVDGNHRKRDFPRFEKGTKTFKRTSRQGHYFVPNPEMCFSAMWLNCPVPVFFDFLGVELPNPPNSIRDPLWQLLPQRVEGHAVVVAVSRKDFVEGVSKPVQSQQVPQTPAVQTRPRVIGNVDPLAMLLRLASQQPGRRPFRRRSRRF